MKKVLLGILTCTTMILGTKGILRNKSANVGYVVASYVTTNGAAQATVAGAVSAVGPIASARLGAQVGVRVGVIAAGPWGMLIGGAVGAL